MKKIISYFTDCYFADKNRKFIKDIFNKDVEFVSFMTGREELINGFFPFMSIDSQYAENISKKAYIYRKEKEIVYCTGLLIGQKVNEESSELYCSPILTQNANILQNELEYSIELQADTLSFNDMLIESLCEDDNQNIKDFQDLLTGEEVLSNNSIATITRLMEERIAGIETLEFTKFPELYPEKEVKKKIRNVKSKKEDFFELIPCSFIALVKKPNEAKGVVGELNTIAEHNDYSNALVSLFNPKQSDTGERKSNTCFVPAILSNAQESIMSSIERGDHTLIIGPPGTGKSYTIAALAMEQLSRGKSVLIASKQNQAVDVIADKINEQLNMQGCVVRGGKQNYLKELKDFLKRLLNSMYKDDSIDAKTLRRLKKEILTLDATIKKIEHKLEKQSQKEIKLGQLYAHGAHSFLSSIQKWYLNLGSFNQKPLWQIYEEYDAMLNKKINKISKYAGDYNTLRINTSLKKHRAVLNTFLKAISSRTGGKQEDLFKTLDFSVLLQIFPVWLVNLSDIHKVLPLKKNLFELVIIDEATQCDIASCLPTLQRAKKAVIAGDPNQLRHISFLSKAKQAEFLDKYDMAETSEYDYRNTSILDLYSEKIVNHQNVVFLNEHYRSLPEIISFSNKEFYDNRLKIMTEKPINYGFHPVIFQHCKEGKREAAGYNMLESELIINQIKELVNNSESKTPSIGILSPFRKQVDYISAEIMKNFSLEIIDKHKILVGTAHSFQGEERDIMFISLCVEASSHSAAFRFIDNPNVFNVAMTRAKSKQHIVHSVSLNELKAGSLLHKFFDFYLNSTPKRLEARDEIFDSFATEVSDALEEINISSHIALPIAGQTMDIVAINGSRSLGIDLIGFPGDFAETYPIERYKMFNRAGMKVIPLPYSGWRNHREECIGYIVKSLR